MSTEKTRAKVDKLMALALAGADARDEGSRNEARNAAVMALRLIDENGMLDGIKLPKKQRQTKAVLQSSLVSLAARVQFLEEELKGARMGNPLAPTEREEFEQAKSRLASLQEEVTRLNQALLRAERRRG